MKMMVHSSCVKRISRSTLVESNSAVSTIITSMRSSRPVISLTPSLSFVSRSQHQVAMPISPLIRPMIDALIVMSTMTTLTSGLLLLELKILMRRKRNSSTRMESRDRIVIFGKNTKTQKQASTTCTQSLTGLIMCSTLSLVLVATALLQPSSYVMRRVSITKMILFDSLWEVVLCKNLLKAKLPISKNKVLQGSLNTLP